MKNTNRRVFLVQVAAGSSALAATQAMAQAAAPKVDEKDPQAAALGYAADTTKVDKKKFPKHSAEQKCSGCQLYTGKPKEAAGPCPLFAGKQVAANGWCSAWVKKA
ncbi:MAG: high-potential iron-sulfur protein [Pseudomonadota bacterium]